MEALTINGIKYVPESSLMTTDLSQSDITFLVIGKIYLFRTVTMIYLGRIKAMTKTELLLEECAWIPETERWAQCVAHGKFKEVEPYTNDVILFKAALLDVTEMASTCMVQK